MKHKIVALFLISNFYPITTTPTTEPAQAPVTVTTAEQLTGRTKLDHYTKCKALLTIQDLMHDPETTTSNGTQEQREQAKTLLANKIMTYHCLDDEFKPLYEFLQAHRTMRQANANLNRYHENLCNAAGISAAEYAQQSRAAFQKIVQELK